MSCNGCRVLRKGCSDTCMLRPCLLWIDSPDAQGHATVFVAKFFGRAGLMSFLSAVPDSQRPSVFQSLLFEAAGRTVNPVNGAVGLLWTGNWHVCRAAVETILRGGTLKPIPDFLGTVDPDECTDIFKLRDLGSGKRRRFPDEPTKVMQLADLDLSLTPGFQCTKNKSRGLPTRAEETRRLGSPSMNSEESLMTTCRDQPAGSQIKLLNLFN